MIIGLIVAISFFNFSESYYPLLNADAGVNILMSASFHLPQDFYYWGQDRGGSLVPMLAHILYSYCGIGLILSVSLVHYLLLFIGYLAMNQMFKNNKTKILLALFWFLPAWHMQFFLVYNFLAIQFCLSVVLVYLFAKAGPLTYTRLSLAGLVLLLATWVSDLAMLSYLVLLGMLLLYQKQYKQHSPQKVLLMLMWVVVVLALVSWARTFAIEVPEYMHGMLGNAAQVKSNVRIFSKSLEELFRGSSENITESIHLWILVAGLGILFFLNRKLLRTSLAAPNKQWSLFFLLHAVVVLGVLLLSKWLFLNGVGRWYFVAVYFSLLLALLLYLDSYAAHFKRLSWVLLFTIAISGSFSGLKPLYFPHHLPARTATLSAFERLGDAGIIGDYWNAYVIGIINPGHLVATPHEQAQLRNVDLPRQVFQKPKLYLVKDMWMAEFPDSLSQFGHKLYKDGKEFNMGDCSVCSYTLKRKL